MINNSHSCSRPDPYPPLQILKDYYGYHSFRSEQAMIIEHLIQGQDLFVLIQLVAENHSHSSAKENKKEPQTSFNQFAQYGNIKTFVLQ